MRRHINRFSPATRGTLVVAEEDEERDVVPESAAQDHDPAPADLDENYRKMLLAYEAGKQTKSAGEKWGERSFSDAQTAMAFTLGWLGVSMPEFGEDE